MEDPLRQHGAATIADNRETPDTESESATHPNGDDGPRRRRGLSAALLIAAAALGLSAGYALKAQCLNRPWNGFEWRHSCYSDVVPLYTGRGLNEKRIPYIDSTAQTRSTGRDLEYPVGTGLYVGIVAQEVSTTTSFFNANAVGLALMGLAAAAALAAMALDPRRVLLYAIGPALVLYGFHNWDLLAVGPATLALYLYWRGADLWAGLLLGVAAAMKLYPAFLLPALALGAWRRAGRPPWALCGGFVWAVAALNVPVMFRNFEGWKYPWIFQSNRPANYETSWWMMFRHLDPLGHGRWFFNSKLVNLISGGLFVAGAAVLIVVEALRKHVRPFALGFGILLWFLVTAKVFSPQYALWLLPFFALLSMPWWSYLAFAVTDAAVWFAVSAYFISKPTNVAFRLDILEAAVWARYAVLLTLLILSQFSTELVREPRPRAEPSPVPITA